MKAKLGDTVEIRKPKPIFVKDTCLQFLVNIELKTLTTQAEVDEWNEEHK